MRSCLGCAGAQVAEMLTAAGSPLIELPRRVKEPDYSWIPSDCLANDPTVVAEVAVFHETEEELLAAGYEWLEQPGIQVRRFNLWHTDA